MRKSRGRREVLTEPRPRGRRYPTSSSASPSVYAGPEHDIFIGRYPPAAPTLQEPAMRYDFLIDTYETERLKVISAWSMFTDDDLPVRPNAIDRRGRSFHEHMVHQCVSEDIWFRT